ncbi:MAG: CHRD domain-containing protein [Deltaproteobacteria bacterium]|nr:CHRD domain-containing protein [Deltaproteobacteria bacterium]
MNRNQWVFRSTFFALAAFLVPGLHMLSAQDKGGYHCILTDDGQRISAEAAFRPDEDELNLHYVVDVRNVADITMAHLHLGDMYKVNTAVLWLYPSGPPPKLIPGVFNGILAEGTVTAKDLLGPLRGQSLSALMREMRAGRIYVNLHTMEHPEGSICGVVSLVE